MLFLGMVCLTVTPCLELQRTEVLEDVGVFVFHESEGGGDVEVFEHGLAQSTAILGVNSK
jgi:uncharacterized protein (UPF0261 family)